MAEFHSAVRSYANAGAEFKSGFMARVRTYAVMLVQYIKREKLSGQVLGKYTGAYDAAGAFGRGQSRWRKKPGTLKKTFGATVYNDPAIQFYETIYGRAWEGGENGEGWSRKGYTVNVDPARGPRARLMFYAGGAWRFAKTVTIRAMSFPAKPHIRPSIKETSEKFYVLIYRPFARYMSGAKR